MRTDILSAEQTHILALLDNLSWIQDFYLAGGTALALQYGHRESIDFDFYTQQSFAPEDLFRRLEPHGHLRLSYKHENTLGVYLDGVTCSFFSYPYPILEDFLIVQDHIRLSSVSDIAAMKVAAISGRGKKRDFVDLYFVCVKERSLIETLELYRRKYNAFNDDLYHIYKSLVYFDDAEADPMPKMFETTDWDEIKLFFEDEVSKLVDDSTQS